jgi:hypothetical protein
MIMSITPFYAAMTKYLSLGTVQGKRFIWPPLGPIAWYLVSLPFLLLHHHAEKQKGHPPLCGRDQGVEVTSV